LQIISPLSLIYSDDLLAVKEIIFALPSGCTAYCMSCHVFERAEALINFVAITQVNRLLYRAKQRGFLEMDLLVGMWAEKNVPKMDAAQLKAMEEVLDQENPDLFKWLTGQAAASEDMQANSAFKVCARMPALTQDIPAIISLPITVHNIVAHPLWHAEWALVDLPVR